MAYLDYELAKSLTNQLERLEKDFPAARQTLVEEMGKAMLGAVQRGIGGAGKVQSWQDVYIGSRGGYAAVRPKAKTYQETQGGGRYAVGYITNAIDNGHQVRSPSGNSKRYRPRIRKTRVTGKQAYAAAAAQLDGMALGQAEAMLEKLAGQMEG